MGQFIDITNQRFGRLVVLEQTPSLKKKVRWDCLCDCGNITNVSTGVLKNGQTISCGCVRLESVSSHKMSDTKEYQSWKSMKGRCNRKTDKSYNRYGGRGIKVCDEWINSFEKFYKDVGSPPSKNHTLGRIDNNGNYEYGNVRWETRSEQNRNKVNNVNITHNDETHIATDWANMLGISANTIIFRYHRGLPFKQVLSTERLR